VSFLDANASSSSAKLAKGLDTGVEFRYYEQSEYNTLSKEQQDELRAWRSTSKSGKKQKNERKLKNLEVKAKVLDLIKGLNQCLQLLQ